MQKIKNVINTIKEKAVDDKVLSCVIHRDDQDVEDKTNELKK